jgi:Spy/CpxP family protein refolding chaperone
MDHDADVERSVYGRYGACRRSVHAASVEERWTMNKAFLRAAAMACLLLGAMAVFAQDAPAPPQGGGGWQRGQMPTAEQRLQRMTQALNLTEDQQAKIKPILENESTQMQGLRSDSSLSQDDRMAKMKQIRENTTSQINPILTPDQQKQYAEMTSRMGRGRGPGQAPPPQPQQ